MATAAFNDFTEFLTTTVTETVSFVGFMPIHTAGHLIVFVLEFLSHFIRIITLSILFIDNATRPAVLFASQRIDLLLTFALGAAVAAMTPIAWASYERVRHDRKLVQRLFGSTITFLAFFVFFLF